MRGLELEYGGSSWGRGIRGEVGTRVELGSWGGQIGGVWVL